MSASHASIDHGSADVQNDDAAMISDILPAGHIVLGHSTTSKKRLLEDLAGMFAGESLDLDPMSIFSTLIERENLGSTGIGAGVALPHGRVAGLTETHAIFMTLAEPLDFAAADGEPVNLVFALLVPEHATEAHLKLLARLASLFRNPKLRTALANSQSVDQVHELLTSSNPDPADGTS